MMNAAGYLTDVAYIPGFYPQMSPLAMRSVAAINGIAPPPTEGGFRWLELGCGLGRVVTTLAAAYPQGEFIGIDVNPEHTKAANHDISSGELDNARVITSDFANLPADLGSFEFIGIHGVYSWVSPDVRGQILQLAKSLLAPGGLLLVSYNAMPGWAHLQPLRGILRQYAALRRGDSLERIRDAFAYLVFLREKHAKYFEDNPVASSYVDGLLKQDPRYLAHEYLNEHWTSFYFADVVSAFGSAGLSFVGSLPLHTNFWDLCVRPEFQELFRTTTNRLVTEAHKDFCANTAFRWDLYARDPRPLRGIEDRFREIDDIRYRVARPDVQLPYRANLGVVTSTVQGPLYEMLVALLRGNGLRLSEIVATAKSTGTTASDLVRAVDAGVAMGLFDMSAHPLMEVAADSMAGASVCHPFNRVILAADALGGRPVTLASQLTGTGHTMSDLDAAILLELTTGGVDGLAKRVSDRLAKYGRTLQQAGQPVSGEAVGSAIDNACKHFIANGLPALARIGIVETLV